MMLKLLASLVILDCFLCYRNTRLMFLVYAVVTEIFLKLILYAVAKPLRHLRAW
jgi:hypothetical protein